MHQKIKNLFRNLISNNPQKKKTNVNDLDMDEVDRKILHEVIEEITGLTTKDLNNEPEEHVMLQVENTNGAGQNWTSAASQLGRLKDPSLNRDRVSFVQSVITLNEETPRVIVDDVPPLPPPTNEEMQDMGIYNTTIGRKVYDRINNTQSEEKSMKLRPSLPRMSSQKSKVSIQPLAEITGTNLIENIQLGNSVPDKIVPQTVNVTNEGLKENVLQNRATSLDKIPNISEIPPEISLEVQPEVPPVNESVQQEIPTTRDLQNKTMQPQAQRASTSINQSSSQNTLQFENISKIDKSLQKVLEDIEKEFNTQDLMINRQKKKRNRRARERPNSPEYSEVQEMHKPLVIHPPKERRTGCFKRPMYFYFQKDMFEGLEDYVEFDRDFDEVPQHLINSPQQNQQQLEQVVPEMFPNEPVIEKDIQPQPNNQLGVNSPDVEMIDVNIPPQTIEPNIQPEEIQPMQQETLRQSQTVTSTPNVNQRRSLRTANRLSEFQNVSNIVPIQPDSMLNTPQLQQPVEESNRRSILPVPRVSEILESEKSLPSKVPQENNQTKSTPILPKVDTPIRTEKRKSLISLADCDFAKRRKISLITELNAEPLIEENIIHHENQQNKFEVVPGKSEDLIEFTGVNGRKEKYSKYCMEVRNLLN
jgi:hypothetical protein